MCLLNEINKAFTGPQWPRFLAVQKQNQEVVLECLVGPDVVWFKGHFDEQAVLPGVVQVHWAGELSKYIFPEIGECFEGLGNVKFHSVILPEASVSLKISLVKGGIAFRYHQLEKPLSEGKIFFRAEGVTE